MKVTLLHNTPLQVAIKGTRTCWDSHDKADCGVKDRELLDRVGNKFKHKSILEHISYNFYIEGVSRALLQELARHRIASLSVKSTRYTLKELKNELSFINVSILRHDELPDVSFDTERAEKYLVLTGVWAIDCMSIHALENLRVVLISGYSNDYAKYCLPESYKTELTWSINMRSLQNFLSLRMDKAALWEIRQLADEVYEAIPEDHKYLFQDIVHG